MLYILPKLPEKFRNRIVYFPSLCESEKLYRRNKHTIDNLKSKWNKAEPVFVNKLQKLFPNLNDLNIEISPSLYGTLGSYQISSGKIIVKPRYDRNLTELQKTLITALTHYYHFGFSKPLDNNSSAWLEKQSLAAKYQKQLLGSHNSKSFLTILNREFAGNLAKDSANYLKILGIPTNKTKFIPDRLTPNETKILDLLVSRTNQLVTFAEIGDILWPDNLDKYSEYAITKLVERLKKKLPPQIIHSQRGVGYLFYQP